MLGLADQVGRDQPRVGRVVGDDEDLGGAGFGIRPHDARDGALGRGDEVVARSRDHVDRIEPQARDPVREGADRARAPHRVHLVDAEQPSRREDDRVHAPAVRALRRRRERDLRHAGDLGRDDVHDDAGRVDRLAAGHVETDATHRLPALEDARAGCELGHRRGRHLSGRCAAHARDRLFERGAHARVEPVAGPRRDARPGTRMSWPDAPSNRSACSRSASSPRAATSATRLAAVAQRLGARSGRARHCRQQFCRGVGATAQIDRAEHASTLSRSARRRLSRASHPRRRAGSPRGRPRGGRRTPRRDPRARAPTPWVRPGRSGRRGRRRRRAPPETAPRRPGGSDGRAAARRSAASTGSNVSRRLGGRPLRSGRRSGLAVRPVAVGGHRIGVGLSGLRVRAGGERRGVGRGVGLGVSLRGACGARRAGRDRTDRTRVAVRDDLTATAEVLGEDRDERREPR